MTTFAATPQVVRGRQVVTPHGIVAASVHIRDGRIERVADYDDVGDAAEVVDAGSLAVLPGFVDTHVHINEPGRTEWEGFSTATSAAAAGGVTTLLDMPLNSIPATLDARSLAAKEEAASDQAWVDVGFIGGVVPGNAGALADLRSAGVLAFKCFLTPSGVDEFSCVSAKDLGEALPHIARMDAVLMVHAEQPAIIDDASRRIAGDPRNYRTYLASRPPAAETDAIAMMVALSAETRARVHIVHISAAESIPLIERASAAGARVTGETCPHYLYFAASDVPDGATEYKCAPPIREEEHREALWQALERDSLGMIVTDHSPCTPDLKRRREGNFFTAWGGIASIQLGASVVWTRLAERNGTLSQLSRWMSSGPARLVGIDEEKGSIEVGRDADLVLFDPNLEWTVDAAALLHRHPITPYHLERLRGRVEATYLRGRLVFDQHGGIGPVRHGQLLLHS